MIKIFAIWIHSPIFTRNPAGCDEIVTFYVQDFQRVWSLTKANPLVASAWLDRPGIYLNIISSVSHPDRIAGLQGHYAIGIGTVRQFVAI